MLNADSQKGWYDATARLDCSPAARRDGRKATRAFQLSVIAPTNLDCCITMHIIQGDSKLERCYAVVNSAPPEYCGYTLCSEKNTHSHFLSYLHELFVDLNKNCSEYTQGLIDSDNVKISYSLRSMT